MFDLTGLQRDLLYCLWGMDEPNGLALKAELERHYDRSVQSGRLYPNLDTLVEKDLIEKGKHDERSNYYRLTDTGERRVDDHRDWVDELVS